jgi:hypothetical protein
MVWYQHVLLSSQRLTGAGHLHKVLLRIGLAPPWCQQKICPIVMSVVIRRLQDVVPRGWLAVFRQNEG